jgi:hypothetical protein
MGSMRAWTTAILLSSMLAAQTPKLVDNPPSETSFHLSQPDFAYPATYRSLRQVDFRNLTLHLFDVFPEPKELPLKDGKYELRNQPLGFGFEVATLDSVRRLPSATDSREEFSVAFYTDTYGGGSSNTVGIAQVFELTDGHLKIVQQMTWDEHFSPPGKWYMRLSDDVLTVRSARYLDGDAHCCISGMDTVTLKWNGSRFAQTRMITERLKP